MASIKDTSTSPASNCIKFKLNEKRLKGEDTDVMVICGENRYPAHKLILTTACEYFQKMFGGDFKEAHKGEATIDMDPYTMEIILNYTYMGKDVNFEIANMDQALALLKASHMIPFMELFGMCCTKIRTIATDPETLPVIESIHGTFNNDDTSSLLEHFLCTHWMTIVKNDLYLSSDIASFHKLIRAKVSIIIQAKTGLSKADAESFNVSYRYSCSTCLYAQCICKSPFREEYTVENTVMNIMNWINHKKEDRLNDIALLFAEVTLEYLSNTFIESLVKDDAVNQNPQILLQLLTSVIHKQRVESDNNKPRIVSHQFKFKA